MQTNMIQNPTQDSTDVAMNILKFTNVKFGNVRVFMNGKTPWFVAADICRSLDLVDVTSALRPLDDDEKMTLTVGRSHSGENKIMTPLTERSHSRQRGGAQFMNVINEFGIYRLIFSSRKKSAKKFQKWITHDVIPSIRNYGAYLDLQHPEVRKMTYEVHNAFQTAISVFDRLCMEPGYFYDAARSLTKKIQEMVNIEVGGKDRASAEQLIKLVILESAFTNKLIDYIYDFKKEKSVRERTDILNSCMTAAENALGRRGFKLETVYVTIVA